MLNPRFVGFALMAIVFCTGGMAHAGVTCTIDIKPGSDPNCINPNGKGNVPVAILATQECIVQNIDTTTLELAGKPVVLDKNGYAKCSEELVDGDGLPDLVCHFEKLEGWGSIQAPLVGQFFNGSNFSGADDLCLIPSSQ